MNQASLLQVYNMIFFSNWIFNNWQSLPLYGLVLIHHPFVSGNTVYFAAPICLSIFSSERNWSLNFFQLVLGFSGSRSKWSSRGSTESTSVVSPHYKICMCMSAIFLGNSFCAIYYIPQSIFYHCHSTLHSPGQAILAHTLFKTLPRSITNPDQT